MNRSLMKSMLKTPAAIRGVAALALGAAVLALAGCGTATVSRQVAKYSSGAESIVFPDAKNARPEGGTFPSLESLRKIEPGVSKAQIQNLLGAPHFNEGVWSVREWDYLFAFRRDGQVVHCQYKVLFDRQSIARNIYWSPASCADFLKPPKPAPVMETGQLEPPKEPLRLSADALFDFDRAELKPAGRAQLDGVAEQWRSSRNMLDLRVVGYTDHLGSDAYNLALSRRRAEAVRDYLVSRGVAAQSVEAEGRGRADPVVKCPASGSRAQLIACLAPNRRVELSGTVKP